MSRAINIDATESEVSASCLKQGLTISAIESLISGGTRVVMMNGRAADSVRQAFGSRVVTGAIKRASFSSRAR